jgi:alkylation response protein AidB-like acyl-CoA dehydrogenase
MSTEDFRSRALAWLEAHAVRVATDDGPANLFHYDADIPASKQFQKALFDAGLAGIMWPKEYGGAGLGAAELLTWNEVAADFVLPNAVFGIGQGMIGPTLLELGTEEQKSRYLPPMLSGQEIWCQLFSEPSGGSDVASLRTTATRTDTGWRINGQKVWTSGAHHSELGAILARTDPTVPKHDGITMLIVDMHHPGVTVRPLRIATGEAPFNEVFFDDVEVPGDAVIGEVNRGWPAAVVMLRNERIMLGAGGRSSSNPLGFERLLPATRAHGTPAGEGRTRDGLAELYARELGLSQFGRLLHEEALAGVPIGARGSVGKLAASDLLLWASDLAAELLGEAFVLDDDLADVRYVSVYSPGHAVAGGSSEIQRNIIGERILGLPKDAGVDKSIPFNQLRLG